MCEPVIYVDHPKPRLREAAIILPMRDGSGNPSDVYRGAFILALVKAFGGVTVTDGRGAWVNPAGTLIEEPVKVLTVAMAHAAWPTLQRMAAEACRALKQEAIYIRYPDGEVVLITAEDAAALTS